jgi:hypothetical protein
VEDGMKYDSSQTSIHSSSESLRPAERMSASSWKYSSRGGRGAGVGLSLTLSAGPAASRSVHVNLDAWSVDTTSTGQVELTLRELRDQALLERTLADAGVPAIVNFGKFCEPVNQADNLTATTGTHFIELPVGRHGDLVAIVGVEDFGAGHGYFVDKIVKDGAPLSCHPIQRVKVKKPAIAAVGG